jgi:hypothetical protein
MNQNSVAHELYGYSIVVHGEFPNIAAKARQHWDAYTFAGKGLVDYVAALRLRTA